MAAAKVRFSRLFWLRKKGTAGMLGWVKGPTLGLNSLAIVYRKWTIIVEQTKKKRWTIILERREFLDGQDHNGKLVNNYSTFILILLGTGGKQPAVSATSEFTAGERRGAGEASGKVQRQPDTDGKIRILQAFSCIFLHSTGNGSKKGGHGTSLYSRMADWSDDESDFTEQIAMIVMMRMQQVVQILQEEEEEEGVVNSQPRTRQPIPRDRVDAHNRLVEHYFAPNCVYPPSVFRRRFRMHKPLFLRILNECILQRGAWSTDRDKVARIMYACCILHNIILEDEGKAVCAYVAEENVVPNPPPIQPGSPESLAIRRALRNRPIHFRLRESLGLHLQTVDHVDLNEIPQDDAEEFSN
ncbi:hypothetical protein LXL04_002104 [Taraxacum kok-saghyz]